jgi:hypothetical protein
MVEIYGLPLTGIAIFLFLIWLTLISVARSLGEISAALKQKNDRKGVA